MNDWNKDPAGRIRVTVIPGDGIGPEVVRASQRILEAAGAPLVWDEQHAGASVFARGIATGVPPETIESIAKNKLVLKGPLATPIGHGEKSANVTLRKLFETYGNIRPVRELPGVPTPFSGKGIDLVVVRENVEDLYAGIEHRQTPEVAQCLKLMSRPGCEKIVRLAFEVAISEGRRRVHCATKANIMKLTEGLMKKTFEEVAKDYPTIEAHHILVDNCAHQLVRQPGMFDVIVTSNMNGDILSDLACGLVGGLGFAPGANIGNDVSIFEAVHGAAPDIAGMGFANPSAVLLSGVMLLRHVGALATAEVVENALLVTLERGPRTRDGGGEASTDRFVDAVVENLGRRPEQSAARGRRALSLPAKTTRKREAGSQDRRVVGVDVFVESSAEPSALGATLDELTSDLPLTMSMISNRGTMVYPAKGPLPDCVDHYRCRFLLREGHAGVVDDDVVLELLAVVGRTLRWMHVEKLQELDGAPAYTLAQGEERKRRIRRTDAQGLTPAAE